MPKILAILLGASVLVSAAGARADAGALANPTDCYIDNPNPIVAVGVRASYLVQLLGGNGSFSVTLSYGDGSAPDSLSTTYTSMSFGHFYSLPGTFGQTATVVSAGSSATCTSTTMVQ